MTTTTGNAATVLDWFEEWLQTEWPELRVPLHLGDRAVGDRRRSPARARATSLGRARPGPRRQPRGLPLHGTSARRRSPGSRRASAASSFSGELAYEVNVARVARARAVGGGLGRGRAVRHHAVRDRDDARAARREGLRDRRPGHRRHGHAAGPRARLDGRRRTRATSSARRSHAPRGREARRPQAARRPPPRPERLPEGAQLVDDPDAPVPVPMAGHVTSSYDSAALGRPFALALLDGRPRARRRDDPRPARGPRRDRAGHGHRAVDPEGARRDG